jgi:nucleoside-diphosphate-sugar epimerase
LWLNSQRSVAALTRRNAPALAAQGIQPIVGDVLEPSTLRQLPIATTVLYAVGFDRTAGKSMREVYIDGLENVLDALNANSRFIYISSTGVYGQTDGSVVDESSSTVPVEEAGEIVLEAEKRLRVRRPDAMVLRFAGIYGPDRLLRRQSQLRSGEPFTGDPDRWLNLIHVDDGARAILAAEAHEAPGAVYNIVDDEPAPRRAFYSLLAELVGAPAPRYDNRAEPRANNRRVSNAKAKSALGWQPNYPSYREGLPAAICESTS